MALEFEESRDLPDDNVTGLETPARAQSGIVFRGGVGSEVEPAEDLRVLLRAANACGEILPGHRVGDGNEMGRHARGSPFGRAKRQVGQRALKGTERESVDGVND